MEGPYPPPPRSDRRGAPESHPEGLEAAGARSSRSCAECGRRYPAEFKVCPHDATPLSDVAEDEDPLVGRLLGGSYEILRLVGEGGMGRVYEARHKRLPSRRFAIKVLHPDLARKAEVMTRFQREAEAASVLSHPNVVSVYDVNAGADGRPYIVAELLEGEELGRHLDRLGQLPVAAAVRIVRQVCRALSAAHEGGIVHRDIKPENVFLVGPGAQVKVLDFGISKVSDTQDGLTKTGTVMGTPDYMAPEQARGDRVDARADVYATGALLYRALTGHKPFEGLEPLATLTAVLTQEPPRPSSLTPTLPLGLELVVQRAMAKEPEARFQSMLELDGALAPYDEPATAGAPALHGRAGGDASDARGARRDPAVPSTSARHEQATRSVRLARPGLVFFSTLAGFWLAVALPLLAASVIRSLREPSGDLSPTETTLVLAGSVAALLTPLVLWIRHLREEVWQSTPRALELQTRLRRAVLYGAAASGIAALLIFVFEVLMERDASALARPGWGLVLVGSAALVSALTWLALSPKGRA